MAPGARGVRVYAGPGAGATPLAYALDGLRAVLPPQLPVAELSAEELRRGGWEDSTALLVFPGGADVPTCEALNGAGTARVAAFVRAGGAYLGLCAGAYFACAACDFERGTPLEVVGPRELAFFPGAAVGAVAPGYAPGSEAGAAAAQVRFASSDAPDAPLDDECVAFVNGAPAFELAEDASAAAVARVRVVARYADLSPGAGAPAAVRCAVGDGVAVLCGPHPEMAPRWLEPPDADAGGVVGAAAAARAAVLRATLTAGDAGRLRFWRSLLAATGVPLRAEDASGAEAVAASVLDTPHSPLRSIGLGPTAPAADVSAGAQQAPPADAPTPLPLSPHRPTAPTRRVSAPASALGPLRACSHADLLALPHVPPLETLVPADEEAKPVAAGAAAVPGQFVYAPLPRLAAWLAATAALMGVSSVTRSAAPKLARATAAAAGAAALTAGASVRLGGPRGGVPITAQTLSACLCGLVLGPQQGVRAAALYAAAAAAGAPVLTPHAGRPTSRGAHTASAGYVAGFALCAAAVGHAAEACAQRRASNATFAVVVAAAAVAAQLATAAMGGAWAAGLLMAEGAAPDGGRPWLLELALASAASVPPFVPGLLLKASIVGAAAAAAAPTLRAPAPPPQPALRRLLE